eukprot:1970751-Alexandrium_andersonii.AAC.1
MFRYHSASWPAGVKSRRVSCVKAADMWPCPRTGVPKKHGCQCLPTCTAEDSCVLARQGAHAE